MVGNFSWGAIFVVDLAVTKIRSTHEIRKYTEEVGHDAYIRHSHNYDFGMRIIQLRVYCTCSQECNLLEQLVAKHLQL